MAKLWYLLKTNKIKPEEAINRMLTQGKENLQGKVDSMPKNYKAMVETAIERYNLIPFNETMKTHYANKLRGKAPDKYAEAVPGIPEAWYENFAKKVFGIEVKKG